MKYLLYPVYRRSTANPMEKSPIPDTSIIHDCNPKKYHAKRKIVAENLVKQVRKIMREALGKSRAARI
jgi:hypothetical protein